MSITEHSGSKHDWIPLTKSAQGIYLAAIIDPKNPCYNTAEIMECPPETNLDYLREAFIQLYRENEGFRVQTLPHTMGVNSGFTTALAMWWQTALQHLMVYLV